MLGGLDILERAAITVDPDGSVLGVNDSALKLFGDDFFIRGKRLLAADQQSRMRLERLFIQISLALSEQHRTVLQAVVARCNRRPVIIDAYVHDWKMNTALFGVGALLLLTDLNEIPVVSQSAVMEVFGLTPAQARLASLLLEGKSLEESAHEMNILSGTARNHLKAVFARTATKRQGELISLLSRLR